MHVRCPQCRRSIDVQAESSFRDIPCPSCGSSFSLVAEDTAATREFANKRTLGHFSIVEQLGAGSFGTVWKARDTELDRFVAIKIPHRGDVSSESMDLFLREARAAAQLKHPNIVSIHEIGRDGETVYIVGDVVDGVTLGDWLTARTMTSREAAALCATIAMALAHAHDRGVIHRDLKPSNIMLDSDGRPHIMDFGLAKREAGEVTMTYEGKVLGTPAYMSPEQAQGDAHRADRRSDVYSLGVILFELLTGERPFRGNSRMLLHQVIHDDPPNPRRLNNAIPRDIETICLKCLRKEPRARYQTASELAEDLQRFLEGREILARPWTAWERWRRRARRNPAMTGLIAAVSVLLVASLGLLFWSLQVRAERAVREAADLQGAIQRQADASRKIGRALDDALTLRGQAEAQPLDVSRWELAIAAARRAEQLLSPDVSTTDLPQRVRECLETLERQAAAARRAVERQQRDERLTQGLDEARAIMSASNEAGLFARQAAQDSYARLFREYGLELATMTDEQAAELVLQASPEVRAAIAGGFDQWLYAGWAGVWEDANVNWHTDASDVWKKIVWSAALVQSLATKAPVWTKLLRVANRVDPDPVRVQLREAAGRFELARFRELVDHPEIETLSPETLSLAAGILRHMGDSAMAISLLNRALQQRPGDYWLHSSLGGIYSDLGRWEDAGRHYAAAVAIRPEGSTFALSRYGAALVRRDRVEESITVLQRAVRLTPNSPMAHEHLAYSLARNNDLDGAVEASRRATELAPLFVAAHSSLGTYLYYKQRWPEAVDSLARAVQLDGNNSFTRELLGMCQLHLGQSEAGLENCMEAVRRRDSGALALALARQADAAGEPLAAWTLLKEALRRQAADEAAKATCLQIGRQLRQRQAHEEAYQAFRAALQFSPFDEDACREFAEQAASRQPLASCITDTRDCPATNQMSALLRVAELLCIQERPSDYREFCRAAWDALGETQDSLRQSMLARILVLTPESGVSADKALELAKSAVSAHESAETLHTLCLAFLRHGRPDDALAAIERCDEIDPNWSPKLNALALALILHAQGQDDEARRRLDQARNEPPDIPLSHDWDFRIRLREVEDALSAEAPAR